MYAPVLRVHAEAVDPAKVEGDEVGSNSSEPGDGLLQSREGESRGRAITSIHE